MQQNVARVKSPLLDQLPGSKPMPYRQLNEVERRISTCARKPATMLSPGRKILLWAESARLKALVDELDPLLGSISNRRGAVARRSELAQKQSEQLDAYLQTLHLLICTKTASASGEARKRRWSTELLAENSENLPPDITAQFQGQP